MTMLVLFLNAGKHPASSTLL